MQSADFSSLRMYPGYAEEHSDKVSDSTQHSGTQVSLLGDIDRLLLLTTALPMPDDDAIENGSMDFLERSSMFPSSVSAQQRLQQQQRKAKVAKIVETQAELMESMQKRMAKFSKYFPDKSSSQVAQSKEPLQIKESSSIQAGTRQNSKFSSSASEFTSRQNSDSQRAIIANVGSSRSAGPSGDHEERVARSMSHVAKNTETASRSPATRAQRKEQPKSASNIYSPPTAYSTKVKVRTSIRNQASTQRYMRKR